MYYQPQALASLAVGRPIALHGTQEAKTSKALLAKRAFPLLVE